MKNIKNIRKLNLLNLAFACCLLSIPVHAGETIDNEITKIAETREVEVTTVTESSQRVTERGICTKVETRRELRTLSHQPRSVRSENYTQNVEKGNGTREILGGVLGGVAGGLLTSNLGKGNGKTAATAAGAILGTFVGANIARKTSSPQNPIRRNQREAREVLIEKEVDYECDKTKTIMGHDVTYRHGEDYYKVFIPVNKNY